MNNFDGYYFNMPGRIVEFFPETQTATVRMCVERIFDSSKDLGSLRSRGLIEGVPVHVLSGGGWSLTMPIAVGDTCIIFFSQVGYDHWLYEDKDEAGTSGGQPMFWASRMFDLQDGYALVGLNTIPRAITGYSAEDAQWRNSDSTQVISLNKDKSIDVSSDILVRVTAPNVEVVAEIEVIVTTPKMTLSGELVVEGGGSFVGDVTSQSSIGANGDMNAGGEVVATGEVTGKGTKLSTHKHPITSGSSAGQTGEPLS